MAQTDALTGLANRRAFDEALQQAWLEAPLPGQATGLLLVDVDHFKRFNDHYGHPAGDACLRQVATALASALRSQDRVARIGGEEFAVLLRYAAPHRLLATAEQLCRGVESLQLPHDGQDGRRVVTISVGSALAAGPDWQRPAALMRGRRPGALPGQAGLAATAGCWPARWRLRMRPTRPCHRRQPLRPTP